MQVLNLIVAFLISFLLVPLNRKLSIKLGVVSYPRERDAHTKPTPRMGGLSVLISFLICIAIFMFFTIKINYTKTLFIFIGAIILGVIGVIDDVYQIKPWQKLLGQIVAIVFAIIGGVNVRFLVWDELGTFATCIQFLNYFGTLFWTLGMINAINLIDGLDGLSSGTTIIAAISFMIIAVANGNTTAMLFAVSLAGAALGFLAHNFHPASIFIGDTGSMLYGYVLAIIALETGFEYLDIVCFMAPLIILAVPIFDTSFAMFRRIINRKPISEADKNHTHHKLMRKGFSHRTTVIILYCFEVLFGITGVFISRTQSRSYMLIAVLILFLLICMIYEKDNFIIDHTNDKNKKESKEITNKKIKKGKKVESKIK